MCPVLEIGLGPPTEDLGSVWSPQKVCKFLHVQPTTKCVFCFFDPQLLVKKTIVALLMCLIQPLYICIYSDSVLIHIFVVE